MQQVHQPSPDSLTFRANLARLISPLRRVRPRVPFFKLAAHRIPTLWSLYRGLLREAPTEDIRYRIRMAFREKQHLTGPTVAKESLQKGYKFLEAFRRANQGDERQKAILQRYSDLIATKSDKAYWKHLARNEVAWQIKLANRPIMTGGYLRATAFNPPLPRLKPQPWALSQIIRKRRAMREKRILRLYELQENMQDLLLEAEFEQELAEHVGNDYKVPFVFRGSALEGWMNPINEAQDEINETFARNTARQNMKYTPEMLATIKAARKEKVANKTRELNQERRGEILRRTILRSNKGPPAHVLAKMTPEQRMMDKVARSVSEVGYVAQVKRKLGFKLRSPDAWKVENGSSENKEWLDQMSRDIMEENERRTKQALEMEISSAPTA
ncbi:hypothetical protein Hypma_006712 [Hypsizygus marmoreus]|uniref:Complex 1 LYR protein domain-containing protein n=1 Tax=Hypsizygus marmoreus TaxID=39966 RepID=A0A369K4P5_HYPMA|nr:hypothetical protein Hypma_006712 [Hypsizygus marmoreus]